MRRIGIDVGGTNTDAVLVADGRVEASVKAPTTADVNGGIVSALRLLLGEASDAAEAGAVLIGTTHFINAVIQRNHLSKVAAIRIGAPATVALPPLCDWPADLTSLVHGGTWFVEGGYDYDGRRFMPLNRDQLRRAAEAIRAQGLKFIAVTSMFSPIDSSDEDVAAEVLRDEIPDASVTCSHLLGGIGLLERENAAVLNASLIALARHTVAGFQSAMAQSGLEGQLYITQNDGTVALADRGVDFPVYGFASGPTNSMRGAAYLSKLQNAIVADVGGTTTDFGHLQNGFPRQANSVVHIGGVRTLFRMPDLLSIGLGGGSIIDADTFKVGPRSVGYRLIEEALVFGGNQLTTTDIAVAAGIVDIGDRRRVAHLAPALIDGVLRRVASMLEENIDRIKTRAGDVQLLAVGGGNFLIPDRLEGVDRIIRVEHGGCANAVGAAIAQISGEVDQVFQGMARADALAKAQAIAEQRAVDAGADAKTISIVEAEDIPIAYLPGNALRVKVKVVGNVGIPQQVRGKAPRANSNAATA